jgi:hypothetical protein
VILSSRQFSGSSCGAFGRIFVAVVVLALVLQGAHACPPGAANASGLEASFSVASPICAVCALAHTLILTLLLILFSLVSTRSRTFLVSQPIRQFLRGL